MNVLTIGADPEVFVSSNGTIVPVIGHLGGTKNEPLRVNLGALQEDNVLAEFNIDPVSTEDAFVFNIQKVMEQLRVTLGSSFSLDVRSSFEFDINTLIASGRQAMQFGCTPDFNVWSMQQQRPNARQAGGLRTAGGHIHVGAEGGRRDMAEAAKRMDLFLGVPSVLMDSDTQRRSLYGQAGSIRFKNYGFEYRTLSNFWLRSEQHMRWAYAQTVRAVESDVAVPDYVADVVNASNVNAARELVAQFGLEIVA